MWKTIIQDTVYFEPGKRNYSLLVNNSTRKGPSINSLTEQEIVKQIIDTESWRNLFCIESRIPNKSVLFGNISRKKFLKTNESGDFDLIAIEKGNPEKVAIYEFKKVKVTSENTENDKINRLNDINTLIGQVRERLKLGFSKVTMSLIIQADLRNREVQNILSNDIARKSSELIYAEMRKAQEINSDIGISYIKFYQPTGKDFNF